MEVKASFYPGCAAHSTAVEYDQSLHAVLAEMGVELQEIEDWNCCGGAAAHSLNRTLGLALPGRNLAIAQESEYPLLVPCPACYNAVRRAHHAVTHNQTVREELERLMGCEYREGTTVQAAHEFVTDTIGLERVRERVTKPLTGLKVVSYYGCLLVRHPEVVEVDDYENPTFLDEIVEVLGGEPRDWSYKTDCCGADLAMTHRDIAAEIADRITGMALEAGADCIMVSCGLCNVNLDMRQTGANQPKVPILYFSELMGTAFDLPGRQKWWEKHIVRPDELLRSLGLD